MKYIHIFFRKLLFIILVLGIADARYDHRSSIISQYSGSSLGRNQFQGSYSPNNPPGYSSSWNNDVNENQKSRSLSDFQTRDSRIGFIRKVYTIFSSQMLATVLITALIMKSSMITHFLHRYTSEVSAVSFLGSFVSVMALTSSAKIRDRFPLNFILLGIFTLLQSITIGTISTLFDPKLVCLGTMHTLTVLVAIVIYSFQPNPKYDLSVLGNTFLAASATLLTGSVLGLFFNMPLMDNITSGLGAILFAAYIAYDTQKIVGGKHVKYAYSQKDYILASISLYQDVLNFYIRILKILSKSSKSKKN